MDPEPGAGPPRRRLALALLCVAVVTAAAVANVSPRYWAPDAEIAAAGDHYRGLRLTRDDFDRDIYRRLGDWAVGQEAPSRDVRRAYPQLAIYFFALPHFASDSPQDYHRAFSLLMALLFAACALVLAAGCRRLGLDPARVWLLALPATLFFSLQRFDLLAALLSVSAFVLLLNRANVAAFALLAAAVLVKVYPVVYLPLFLLWTWQQQGQRQALRGAAAFAGFAGACSLQLALWTSWDAPLASIVNQGSRMDNPESLYHFARQAIPALGETAGRRLFQLLQVAPVIAAFWWRPRSPIDLLRWATVATLSMVLFSRFQSPQWIVWITPLAILACRTRGEIALLVAADLLTYLYFPLAWDLFGSGTRPFDAVLALNLSARAALLLCLLRPVSRFRTPPASR